MGNVPISCCRSKSPRVERSSSNGGHRSSLNGQYSANNLHESGYTHHDGKFVSHKSQKDREDFEASQQSHNLQHISEREPDDVETDPSSNPSNRPIFATRSAPLNKNNYSESYSSNNSTIRKQSFTLLLSSRDHGYNSTTSTDITQNDCQLIDSFDNSIQFQRNPSQTIGFNCDKSSLFNNDSSALNSPICADELVDPSAAYNITLKTIQGDSLESKTRRYLRKSSSCSTIYLDGSTISQPDLRQTIKCVSLAIYYHIKNRTSDNSSEIFDEQLHPLKMPVQTDNDQDLLVVGHDEYEGRFGSEQPNQRTIYSFVRTLFRAAQLTSEYAITTLVYLERLMTYAEMDLTPRTWRRMFLGAILLSSKVWEDQAVWNVDYAQILEEISVEDINELERQFLELIQFNMNVPSSVYAKYYFHLRTLAQKNGLSQEYTLLTIGKARTLEVSTTIVAFGTIIFSIDRLTSEIFRQCQAIKPENGTHLQYRESQIR